MGVRTQDEAVGVMQTRADERVTGTLPEMLAMFLRAGSQPLTAVQQGLIDAGGKTMKLDALMAWLKDAGAAFSEAQVALLRSHGWPVPAETAVASSAAAPIMVTMAKPGTDAVPVPATDPKQPLTIQVMPGQTAEQVRAQVDDAVAANAVAIDKAAADAAKGPVIGTALYSQQDKYGTLLARSSLGGFVAAAATLAQLSGPEAELSAELKLMQGAGRIELPLDLVFPPEAHQRSHRAEVLRRARADVSSELPSGAGMNPGGIAEGVYVPPVFPSSLMARLCRMVRVPNGQVNHTVMTTSGTADLRKPGETQDATAAVWAVKTADPKALRGRLVYRLQDAAKLARIEGILQTNLISVLGDKLDKEGVQGDATANVQTFTSNGFFNAIGAAQTTTFANPLGTPGTMTEAQILAFYLELLNAGVDGRYAEQQSDVQATVTPALYRALLGLPVASLRRTVLSQYKMDGAGLMGSAYIGEDALAVDQTVGILTRARGLMDAAICSVWPVITIIRDQTTAAAEGEVILTANMLVDLNLVRAENFELLKVGA